MLRGIGPFFRPSAIGKDKQEAPACTIQTQAEAVVELFKHQAPKAASGELVEPEICVIGIRHGEKMYETLLTTKFGASPPSLTA